MPLSAADIVQQQTGSGVTTSTVISLPAATTAGNTVIVVYALAQGITANVMTNFVRDNVVGAGNAKVELQRKSNVGAETSWTLTTASANAVAWAAFEFQGLDLDSPKDVTPSAMGAATAAATWDTFSSGTNPRSTAYDAVVIAAHAAYVTGGSPPTISAHTQGFEEVAEQAATLTNSIDLSVSMLFTQSLVTPEPAATRSDGAVHSAGATHVVYAAAGSGRVPDVAAMFGGEILTAAGIATGNAGNAPFDQIAGTPAVGNNGANARTGSGYLEISTTAAAEYAGWLVSGGALGLTAPTTPTVLVASFGLRFPGALPAADVDLCTVGASVLWFRVATGKLGFKVSAGTEQPSASTVAADTWYQLDLRQDSTTTTRKGDWRIDGVAQPQGTHTAGSLGGVWFGAVSAGTLTARYDDIVVAKGGYPLGAHELLPLKVDPAGTLTISGTTANFQTFTANGTLVAWNATTARGAIDDVPVTLGAGTSDGFAQITAAAGDYVEIPMETHQAVPAESIRGVRVYVPGWSPSATAQSFRLDSYDGTTATTLLAAADPNFDNSTTAPAWVCRMAGRTTTNLPFLWTQAQLDALAFRVGFSAAAQDVGIHSILAEVAVQPVQTQGLFGDLASAEIDPVTGGVQGVTVDTTTTGATADLTYEEAGTPTTVNVAANDTVTETIEAPDAPTVNRIELQPAAEWPGPEPPPEPQ